MMQLRHLRTLLCAGVLAVLTVPAHAQLTIDVVRIEVEVRLLNLEYASNQFEFGRQLKSKPRIRLPGACVRENRR